MLGANVGHSEGGDGTINGLLGIMQVLSIIALVLSIFLLLSTITTLITEQIHHRHDESIGAGAGK